MPMTSCRPGMRTAVVCLLACLPAFASAALAGPPGVNRAPAQTAAELRERASDLTYNLDHAEALGLLRQAIAVEPNNPANYRALAASTWLTILFQRGAVTVDHYLGSFRSAN